MKRIVVIILVICTLLFSGCAVLQEMKEGTKEAMTLSNEFCSALSEGDIDAAKECLHTESTPNKSELAQYISSLEQKYNIDFSTGIVLKKATSTESAYYDSRYDGSVYSFTYNAVIGGKSTYMFFTIVKNDNGYGIYNFGIEQ